ncbi:hypothetical protein ACQ4PT_069684 [Festuca glaucescens]
MEREMSMKTPPLPQCPAPVTLTQPPPVVEAPSERWTTDTQQQARGRPPDLEQQQARDRPPALEQQQARDRPPATEQQQQLARGCPPAPEPQQAWGRPPAPEQPPPHTSQEAAWTTAQRTTVPDHLAAAMPPLESMKMAASTVSTSEGTRRRGQGMAWCGPARKSAHGKGKPAWTESVEMRQGEYKNRDHDGSWYFLSSRVRKYENGDRPSRCTEDGRGRWKTSTGSKSAVVTRGGSNVHYSYSVLNYFEGPTYKDEDKGEWLMREITVPQYENKLDGSSKRRKTVSSFQQLFLAVSCTSMLLIAGLTKIVSGSWTNSSCARFT